MKSTSYPKGTKVRITAGARIGMEGIVHLERDGAKHALVDIDGMIHKVDIMSLEAIEENR